MEYGKSAQPKGQRTSRQTGVSRLIQEEAAHVNALVSRSIAQARAKGSLFNPRALSGRYTPRGLAVVDIETTGTDPVRASVVEIAVIRIDDDGRRSEFSTLVDPGVDIPPAASALHHITNEMVAGKPDLATAASAAARWLFGVQVVSHNADFDAAFLAPALGIDAAAHGWICTYRLAMHLFPEAPDHSNQTLRYWLKLPADQVGDGHCSAGALPAHRALADARVTAGLLMHLADEYAVRLGDEPCSLERLRALSDRPIKPRHLKFGVHAGVPFDELPSRYITYCLANFNLDRDTRGAMETLLASRSGRSRDR